MTKGQGRWVTSGASRVCDFLPFVRMSSMLCMYGSVPGGQPLSSRGVGEGKKTSDAVRLDAGCARATEACLVLSVSCSSVQDGDDAAEEWEKKVRRH